MFTAEEGFRSSFSDSNDLPSYFKEFKLFQAESPALRVRLSPVIFMNFCKLKLLFRYIVLTNYVM